MRFSQSEVIMSLGLMILGMIVLAVYIPEKIRGYTVKAVLIKSVVSVLFIAVAVSAGSQTVLAKLVIIGLVFGLLGDIWLDLKYVFPEHDELFTYAGFAVFGVGHILYVTGLLIHYGTGRFLTASFALAALASALVAVLEKPMKLEYGKMKMIVVLYGLVLFSTVFVSGGLLLIHGGTGLLLFFIGSVLFALSDLVLSGTYFGEGKERPVDIASNYILYYAGQFLIAFSLTFI